MLLATLGLALVGLGLPLTPLGPALGLQALPAIYFPLLVPECLMIEPTETESKETLDAFIEALHAIVEQAKSDPQSLFDAPVSTVVGRVDETRAARQPDLRWRP